jgi:gamma-glutamylcyclotransferase
MTNKFFYFAYGSNMLSKRLKSHDRSPSATAIDIGYVENRRLTFDKVSKDGSGKCDIESTCCQTDRVYGVIYEIPSIEKANLDKAEGLGKGYQEINIQVVTSKGIITAISYFATKKEPSLRPYHWYKLLVVTGAIEHGLPTDYIEWLKTFESIPDPNI